MQRISKYKITPSTAKIWFLIPTALQTHKRPLLFSVVGSLFRARFYQSLTEVHLFGKSLDAWGLPYVQPVLMNTTVLCIYLILHVAYVKVFSHSLWSTAWSYVTSLFPCYVSFRKSRAWMDAALQHRSGSNNLGGTWGKWKALSGAGWLWLTVATLFLAKFSGILFAYPRRSWRVVKYPAITDT